MKKNIIIVAAIIILVIAVIFIVKVKFFPSLPVPLATPSPTPLVIQSPSVAPTPIATPWVDEKGVVHDRTMRYYVNLINVDFTDDATREDAERIGGLINAKISGYGSTTNLYEFQISTRTKEELEQAIDKIDALNDPKIEGVFPSFLIRAY